MKKLSLIITLFSLINIHLLLLADNSIWGFQEYVLLANSNSGTMNDISNWGIYKNDKFGLRIKYPNECQIVSEGYGECIAIKGDMKTKGWPYFSICHANTLYYNPPPKTDLIKWLNQHFKQFKNIPPKPNLYIHGTPAVKIYSHGITAFSKFDIFFLRKDKIYQITLNDIDSVESQNIYNQMLSTLEFIN